VVKITFAIFACLARAIKNCVAQRAQRTQRF
jgi:hypothetical protein